MAKTALVFSAQGSRKTLTVNTQVAVLEEHGSLLIHKASGRVVVSGHASAAEKVVPAAKEKGAMTAVRLPISLLCHCMV
jgi:hypothetical protein